MTSDLPADPTSPRTEDAAAAMTEGSRGTLVERMGIEFLEASPEVLVRRFENVRRQHPLQGSGRQPLADEDALVGELPDGQAQHRAGDRHRQRRAVQRATHRLGELAVRDRRRAHQVDRSLDVGGEQVSDGGELVLQADPARPLPAAAERGAQAGLVERQRLADDATLARQDDPGPQVRDAHTGHLRRFSCEATGPTPREVRMGCADFLGRTVWGTGCLAARLRARPCGSFGETAGLTSEAAGALDATARLGASGSEAPASDANRLASGVSILQPTGLSSPRLAAR